MATEIQAPKRRGFIPKGRTLFFAVLILVLALAGGFFWLLFQPSNASGPAGGIGIGQPAPDFTLSNANGQPVSLSSFRGHPVIINFWASYCAPCQSETPLLKTFYDAHQAQGLVILGVNEGEPLSILTQYAQNYNVTYPVLADRTLQFKDTSSYDPVPLPRTYFIDKQGIVRAVFNGALGPDQLQANYQRISG